MSCARRRPFDFELRPSDRNGSRHARHGSDEEQRESRAQAARPLLQEGGERGRPAGRRAAAPDCGGERARGGVGEFAREQRRRQHRGRRDRLGARRVPRSARRGGNAAQFCNSHAAIPSPLHPSCRPPSSRRSSATGSWSPRATRGSNRWWRRSSLWRRSSTRCQHAECIHVETLHHVNSASPRPAGFGFRARPAAAPSTAPCTGSSRAAARSRRRRC